MGLNIWCARFILYSCVHAVSEPRPSPVLPTVWADPLPILTMGLHPCGIGVTANEVIPVVVRQAFFSFGAAYPLAL